MRGVLFPIGIIVLLASGGCASTSFTASDVPRSAIDRLLHLNGVDDAWHVEQYPSESGAAPWRVEASYNRVESIPHFCETSVLVLDVTRVNGAFAVSQTGVPERLSAREPCSRPFASSARFIPSREIEALLAANGVPTPWAIDEGAPTRYSPDWFVTAYFDPRQIEPQICVMSFANFEFARNGHAYTVEMRETSRRVVSLRTCNDVRKDWAFSGELANGISDEDLRTAVHAALSLPAGRSPVQISFESENLKSSVLSMKPRDLWEVTASPGIITLEFFAKDLRPDFLAIDITMPQADKARVYLQNGPDIVADEPD